MLLKDNIGTADGMHTSAGSLALAESFAPKDAFLVEKLRAAGCIILGKSNMSEWANARGRDAIGGWSGRGKLTRNPYALDRSAGGSSSGTAAAVSANLVPVAIGTETMGSIVTPASMCGIVGLKPTVGLVSRAGLIPVSYTQDTAGPMTRTVRDAAVLLSAIAGPDPDDAATTAGSVRRDADYTTFLDPDGLRGARIGVARNVFGDSLVADRVIDRALDAMARAGAIIVENADIETADAVWGFDSEVLSYELKASLNAYLKSLGPKRQGEVAQGADRLQHPQQRSGADVVWAGDVPVRREPRTALEQRLPAAARHGAAAGPRPRHRCHPREAQGGRARGAHAGPRLAGRPAAGRQRVARPVRDGRRGGLPDDHRAGRRRARHAGGHALHGHCVERRPAAPLAYGFEQTVRARRAPTFLPTVAIRP